MGTTLANLHVLGGDEQQIREMFPAAVVGRWGEFVSVYCEEFEPVVSEKKARALSKKQSQPVLSAWIFDSDAVGFTVYQNGKTVAAHILDPDGNNKMGNIALFCEALGLPAEDVPRLRFIWKKGDAEEQMELTSLLLTAPLYHDFEIIPDKQYMRDTETVDKWIAERPAPPKIKSETKAVLLQELPDFRWYYSSYIALPRVEPHDARYQFWTPDEDGTIRPSWSSDENLRFFVLKDRLIGVSNGSVAYDSAGLLSVGYNTNGDGFQHFLPDGGFLRHIYQKNGAESIYIYTRFAPDGSEMWKKNEKISTGTVLGCENGEIILLTYEDKTEWLERIDDMTGVVLERVRCPFGQVWSKAYNKGFWWVAADGGRVFKDGKWESKGSKLIKLDDKLNLVAEISLPTFPPELFFSPDGTQIYVFLYRNQILVVNTETLAVENVLKDKSYLGPLCFDRAGRFWLQRDNSTVEAWNASLSKALSRHKLKGEIMRHHKDGRGALCVVAWRRKEKTLRVYKMADLL